MTGKLFTDCWGKFTMILLWNVPNRLVVVKLWWTTAHGRSVGWHFRFKSRGSALFPLQLYPVTSVLAFGKFGILSDGGDLLKENQTGLNHNPFKTVTALGAEGATGIAPRTSWALLVPYEMTLCWSKGKCIRNNVWMWQSWMISQLWLMQSCMGCGHLQTDHARITDPVLLPFHLGE